MDEPQHSNGGDPTELNSTAPEVGSVAPTPPSDAQPSRSGTGGRSARVIQQQQTKQPSGKRFSSFLSHFKREAGTEARLVQMQLKEILAPDDNKEVFLDSDNLNDLRLLLDHVKDTDVLVLLQTKGVLTRPWVILELFTALTNNVPIVALNIANAFRYDYSAAMEFLLHFDEEIDIANPGAAELLIENGVDPVDVAYLLSDALPNIISTDFNPNGSSNIIRASLVDLVDQMRQATPLAPTMSKEEWLEKRKASMTRREAKPHGKGAEDAKVAVANTVASSPSNSLARVPKTVPELPNAYLVRDSDINGLKSAVMSKDGGGSTALTSKQQKQHKKVGAHGMGGVGKTTIAAALAVDEEIRSFFDKVVWESLGQEPDLREAQESIHGQLAGVGIPESATTDALRLKALEDAAKGSNVLLILDDVWDPKHEKALNCIDTDNNSRVLVTTRIRGLLKNSAEVEMGVLPQEEALKLLLSSAEIDTEDLDSESDEFRFAAEIVELCGRLPLTLAIAGGMIADNGSTLSEDIVDVMKESHDLEDEEGRTLEERVISSSVKMMIKGAGKHKELVEKAFLFFAVFPEDVPVPAAVFNKVAPLLTSEKNEKKARLAVGSSLSTLLKYNLIKGSLAVGNGVFMHDVIRDFVINAHSEEDLRELQKGVVDVILAARPEPDGFLGSNYVAPDTFEGYVARHLYVHLQGAMTADETPQDVWLCHPDRIILSNVAMAVGSEALTALSEAREAAGELVGAARAAWTASMHKGFEIRSSAHTDLLYLAAGLLERADDKELLAFETEVATVAGLTEMGSERNMRVGERLKAISIAAEATGESKTSEAQVLAQECFMKLGVFTGSDMDYEGSMKALNQCIQAGVEAGPFFDKIPTFREYMGKVYPYQMKGYLLVLSTHSDWDPSQFRGEEQYLEGMKFYNHQVCSRHMKEMWHFDAYRACFNAGAAVLFHGNFNAVDVWVQKTLAAYNDYDLPTTREFAGEAFEISGGLIVGACPVLIMLGQYTDSAALLNSVGFTWSKEGFENHEMMSTAFQAVFPILQIAAEAVACRLLVFLSSPIGTIDESEVNDWMPSPTALAEMERGYPYLRLGGGYDITSFGALAFLRLGRDDDAYALARLAVVPEQDTKKKTTLVTCHSILGQVAAKRGEMDEADIHFKQALEEARLSRFPMLEVITARDWIKYALGPAGRELSSAEAVIDAACGKMNKTREQLSRVLEE